MPMIERCLEASAANLRFMSKAEAGSVEDRCVVLVEKQVCHSWERTTSRLLRTANRHLNVWNDNCSTMQMTDGETERPRRRVDGGVVGSSLFSGHLGPPRSCSTRCTVHAVVMLHAKSVSPSCKNFPPKMRRCCSHGIPILASMSTRKFSTWRESGTSKVSMVPVKVLMKN